MSTLMEDDIKRWTAQCKTALVLDIIQGKTTISQASRAFDLNPSEVEQWVDEGKRGMDNALRTKPLEFKEQDEKQLRELQKAYGQAMLEQALIARYGRLGRVKHPFLLRSDNGLVFTAAATRRWSKATGCSRNSSPRIARNRTAWLSE